MDTTLISFYVTLMWVIALSALAIFIITYVFYSLAFYAMARERHLKHAWFAWVPFFKSYTEGLLIGNIVPFFGTRFNIPAAKWILTFGLAGILAFGMLPIPYVASVLLILLAVYAYLATYRVYRLYYPERASWYLVFSIVCFICIPFFMFSLRHRKPAEYRAPLKPGQGIDPVSPTP